MSGIEYDISISGYVEEEIMKRFRAIVFDTWNRLSIYTPVLTGRAKSNWRTLIGAEEDSPIERFSGQPVGVQDQGASQAELIRVLTALSIKDTVVIFNVVPYIERIESGWPGNPPHPGYYVVERTINDIETKYANE